MLKQKSKSEESGARKLSDEVKTLTGDVFLERLASGVIKAKELPPEIAGAQSNFILLTDESTRESYIIILPKAPQSPINLKASVILRNYLYESEYAHPNLIEFVPFKGGAVFIDKLSEYNESAKKWCETWTLDNLCEWLSGGGDSTVVQYGDPKMVQYAAWFYDIACSKKANGISLMKIFADAKDSAECQKLLQPSAQLIFQGIVSATLHIHALQHNHTDISSGNVLFDQATKQVKLIDINAARPYDEKGMVLFSTSDTSADGTPLSIPPEVLIRNSKKDVEVASAGMDAFSLGVIYYQLLAGKQEVNIFNVNEKEFKRDLVYSLQTHYTELMKKSDDEIYTQIELSMKRDGIVVDSTTKNLLCKLLHPNPAKRLQIHQIYSHPYFSKQTAETTREVLRAHQTALQIGNRYMTTALEKTYPHIFLEKILIGKILPYLQDFKETQSRPSIFSRRSLSVIDNTATVKSLMFTIDKYLQPYQPRNEDWVQEIAGIIVSAGQAEPGQLPTVINEKMQEFSKLIASLIPQERPLVTSSLAS